LIIILIPTIFVGSWIVRNKHVRGRCVFATGGTTNLFFNYNDQNPIINRTGKRYGRNGENIPQTIKTELKKTPSPAEKEKILKSEARNFFLNPWKVLKIASVQCVRLWHPIPKTTTKGGMA
jgi:hypothetical protein